MLRLCLSYDSFGGRQKVVDFLIKKGLLNKTCPYCNKEGTLLNENGRGIPRFYCPCRKLKFSCAVGTAFNWKQVRNIPLFIFVALCFCLRVSIKSIQALSGADYRTVKRYITVLREALSACAKKEHREGRLKLGGIGKVVEIDEMFVCHRKYHRGRRHAKEGVWVLGLTEVKSASHPIEDPRLLKRLKKDEAAREKAAQKRLEQRKRKLPAQPERPEPTLPSPFGHSGTVVPAPTSLSSCRCRTFSMTTSKSKTTTTPFMSFTSTRKMPRTPTRLCLTSRTRSRCPSCSHSPARTRRRRRSSSCSRTGLRRRWRSSSVRMSFRDQPSTRMSGVVTAA